MNDAFMLNDDDAWFETHKKNVKRKALKKYRQKPFDSSINHKKYHRHTNILIFGHTRDEKNHRMTFETCYRAVSNNSQHWDVESDKKKFGGIIKTNRNDVHFS
jgi:hypothetical protein